MLICSILTATGSNFEDEIKAKGRICFKSVVTDQECGFNFTKKKKIGYATHISILKPALNSLEFSTN